MLRRKFLRKVKVTSKRLTFVFNLQEVVAAAIQDHPRFSEQFQRMLDIHQAALDGALACNKLTEWPQDLFCQCEWKDDIAKVAEAFSDFVQESVSEAAHPPCGSEVKMCRFPLQLTEAEAKVFWRTFGEVTNPCFPGNKLRLLASGKFMYSQTKRLSQLLFNL